MNVYDRTVAYIRDRRREALDNGYALLQNALNSDGVLHASFVAYQAEMIKNAKGEKTDLTAARAAYDKELKRLGLTKDVLEPPPHCKICGDSGYHNGKYCSCVIREVINSDKANITIPTADFDTMKNSAPSAIKKAYGDAERYVGAYPNGDKPFLMLFGTAGTGKTVLSSAVLDSLMRKGASAVAVTAFDFVRRALEYHTQFSIPDYIDRFTPMLDCDLLIIDDIGKETMLKNVTIEYLYAVINERWLKHKYTVVTSNLKLEDIFSRYGEAISSRLFDKNISVNIIISGKNAKNARLS